MPDRRTHETAAGRNPITERETQTPTAWVTSCSPTLARSQIPTALLLIVALVAALAAAYLIVRYAWFRLAFVTFGTVLMLGSAEVSPSELAFLGGAGLALALAVFRIEQDAPAWLRTYARIIYGYIATLGVWGVIGLVRGNDLLDVVRDGASYGLLAVVALVAADAGRTISERTAVRFLIGATAVSLPLYMAFWLDKRAAVEFDWLPELLLYTPRVALAMWCFALVVVVRERRYWWLIAVYGIPPLLLITGTRSHFLLVLGPILYALVLTITGQIRDTWWQLVKIALIGALAGGAMLGLLLVSGITGDAKIATRLSSIVEAVQDPFDLPSLEARREVNVEAWELFTDAPILGNGLGTTFIFVPKEGGEIERLTVDTTLSTIAKLGIVGTAILIATTLAAVWVALPAVRWRDTLILFFALAGLYAILLSLFEDKGFAIALGLLVAGAVAGRTELERSPEPVAEQPA